MSAIRKNIPTVSVIIPTYCRAYIIGRAIQSVLNQSYNDFEIIIVDDCSNDNTEEIVKNFKDERIKYFRHEKNKGAPAARNTGIKVAKGQYIAFQDSDDEWYPKKLELQMKLFENESPQVGIVYTGFLRLKGNEKEYVPYSWVNKKDGNIFKELLKGNFVSMPTMVVRKECLEKVGVFDERLPRLQDWELALRLAQRYEFRCIDESLLISSYTPDSITSDRGARIKALKIILSKHLNAFSDEKDLLSAYYYGISNYLCLNNEVEEGEKYAKKAFSVKQDKRLLSEHCFIVGRRLYSNSNIKIGRNYLIKAIRAYPLNIKCLLVFFISFFGQGVYNKILEVLKKTRINIPDYKI